MFFKMSLIHSSNQERNMDIRMCESWLRKQACIYFTVITRILPEPVTSLCFMENINSFIHTSRGKPALPIYAASVVIEFQKQYFTAHMYCLYFHFFMKLDGAPQPNNKC